MFVSKNITLLAAILATLTIGHAEKVGQSVGNAIAHVGSSGGNQQVSSPKEETKPVAAEALVPAESCTCESERAAKKAESAAKVEEPKVKAATQPEIQVRARLDSKTAEMLEVEELPLILTKTSKDTTGQESGESVPKGSSIAGATEEKAVEDKVEKAAPVEKESGKPLKKVKTDKKRSKRDAKGKTNKNKNSSKGKRQKQSQKKSKK